MARMSEAMCEEVIRRGTSRMLYPYPEHEKPYPVVILDTTAGDITLEVLPLVAAPGAIPNRLVLIACWF